MKYELLEEIKTSGPNVLIVKFEGETKCRHCPDGEDRRNIISQHPLALVVASDGFNHLPNSGIGGSHYPTALLRDCAAHHNGFHLTNQHNVFNFYTPPDERPFAKISIGGGGVVGEAGVENVGLMADVFRKLNR